MIVKLSFGYVGILWIRVQVDIGKPLKWKKCIVLSNSSTSYVNFVYEKLTLFCFLYGKLGHRESVCPLRVLQDEKNLAFGWDLSLWAPLRRAMVPFSHWLLDERGLL